MDGPFPCQKQQMSTFYQHGFLKTIYLCANADAQIYQDLNFWPISLLFTQCDMSKRLYIENILLFYTIIFHFLVSGTGGGGVREKMEKCDREERGLMSDVLFKWTLMKRNFNMQLMFLRLNYLKINLPLIIELWYEQEYFNPYKLQQNEVRGVSDWSKIL